MNYYAVIGNPISHSISPRLHNGAFSKFAKGNVYSRILFETDITATKFKEKFLNLALSGANVTVPFKEIALSASDEVDEFASKIGSVNTLLLKNSKILAFNTDAPGFLKAISEFNNIQNAIILGAGGTARAISTALKENKISVSILNRSKNKENSFKNCEFFTPENFEIKSYDIVINTTPAGLTFDGLPFGEEILNPLMSKAKYAFDAVYGRKTAFLELADRKNLKYKDGKDMLLYQAVFAFDIFTQQKFDIKDITQVMQNSLNLQ